MIFTCSRNAILEEMSNANDFAAQRTNATIYSNVYLSLKGDNLTIKASDSKMGYISEITVEGKEDGSTTVICSKYYDIIRNLPDDIITFSEKDNKLKITTSDGSSSFTLKTIDSSVFPVMELPEENNYFKILQKDFTDMINQTSFAVSEDESKFAMNGALLEKDAGSLIMVATDGRRLSYIQRKIDHEIPDFNPSIIPAKFLSIVKKISLNEGNFEISINSVSIYIKSQARIIFSNLIKNEFPAYKRAIPENLPKSFTLKIKDFDDALRRVSILVENKYKKVIIEVKDNTLTLNSANKDVGDSQIVIPCSYEGSDSVKCAMNYIYLMNPLKVMEGEYVKVLFTDGSRPFVLKPADERDYLHVIMPMNIN